MIQQVEAKRRSTKRAEHVPAALPAFFVEGQGVRVSGCLFIITKIKRGTMTLRLCKGLK